MWRSNKKEFAAVISAFIILFIWNIVNISHIRELKAKEENLREEQERLDDLLCSNEEELPSSYIYIDRAIDLQNRITQKLDSVLGDKFRDSVFTIPEDYKPGANESKKVFYARLSTDVRAKLIKKMNLNGMKLKTSLNFGKPDEITLEENTSMLYLIEQVINAGVENGLHSLESIHQKPKEISTTDDGRFTFVLYRAHMEFTGNAANILSFIDRFQASEARKEKIFLEHIQMEQREQDTTASMEFMLISYKGESEPQRKKPKEEKPEKRKPQAGNIKPIGI